MIYIVMGVSGSGKTTIGLMLARQLKLPFYDADDFHSHQNIEKMTQGFPLSDEDRVVWLNNLGESIKQWENEGGAVLACSALKEAYRTILKTVKHIFWIYLDGSRETILERVRARHNHYMPPVLLDSQLEALEKPAYGLHIEIALPPEQIIEKIMSKLIKMNPMAEFGIIGLGVMGKSLALNLAAKDVKVAIYNRHVPGKEEAIANAILLENPAYKTMSGFDDLEEFVQTLEKPRKILLMIYAGAIDAQLEALIPLLEPGDVIMDGGNSFYKDTSRRTTSLAEKGIHFVGTGISGGEEGARKGPSIMPGGPEQGYEQIKEYLQLIAAKDKNGAPCSSYIGPDGAGHFVKMVHNGIEYAEMQVLAEVYYLLRYHLQLAPDTIADVLSEWQQNGLGSYLLEITIDILRKKEDGELLLDKVLDQAEQKGTGGWSVGAALDYGISYSALSEAVMARAMSARKAERKQASELYQHQIKPAQEDQEQFISALRNACQAARIVNHAIGFNLMQEVSEQLNWNLDFSEIARIWTNGCIIRSELMEELVNTFKSENRLLRHSSIAKDMKTWQPDFAYVVAQGLQHGFALPVLSAAFNYYLGYITADSPANLIQAQRDYFGAHTYQRKDKEPGTYFHSNWKKA